jgi:competence protein ComEA
VREEPAKRTPAERAKRAPRAALAGALALWLAALPCQRPAARPPPAGPPARGAARLLWGLPLDLNGEDVRTLEVLPGIGPTRARAIVAARPFCKVDEVLRVPGIGPATLQRLLGRIAASAPSTECGD